MPKSDNEMRDLSFPAPATGRDGLVRVLVCHESKTDLVMMLISSIEPPPLGPGRPLPRDTEGLHRGFDLEPFKLFERQVIEQLQSIANS